MTNLTEDMVAGVETLVETAKADYRNWMGRSSVNAGNTDVRKNMIAEYEGSIRYQAGSKYIKVIQRNSVHSFIVNTDKDKKFRKGDILKPASWAAPARNFARGNVLDGDFSCIRWTSAL